MQVKVKRNPFSLIELLIVIGIMAALAALILPQFAQSEDDAKDTVCDYNQAGTLRYVTMFRGANGAYPSGFHSGYQDGGTALPDSERVEPTYLNMGTSGTLSGKTLDSMVAAGIMTLAQGHELAEPIGSVPVCQVATGETWYEKWDDAKTDGVADSEIKINGIKLDDYCSASTSPDGKPGVVIPLFAAPTINWDNYYTGDLTDSSTRDSKVSIPLVGKCPWPDDGHLRYYICFFKAYADGSAAKMIGTCCPECGSLHGGGTGY